jgi:transposase
MRQPVKPQINWGGGLMIMSRRVFNREFKLAAIKELESGKTPGQVARRLEIHPTVVCRWRREFEKQPAKAFSGQGKRMLVEGREAELERKIGQLTMENDFLKKLLVNFEEQREARIGEIRFTRRSSKKTKR